MGVREFRQIMTVHTRIQGNCVRNDRRTENKPRPVERKTWNGNLMKWDKKIIMKEPEGVEIFETVNSKYWFKDGIMYIVVKKMPEEQEEERERQVDEFRRKMGGKKFC